MRDSDSLFLFEMRPYMADREEARRAPMPLPIRRALARVKQALDAVPKEEMQRRRRRWEAVARHRCPV